MHFQTHKNSQINPNFKIPNSGQFNHHRDQSILEKKNLSNEWKSFLDPTKREEEEEIPRIGRDSRCPRRKWGRVREREGGKKVARWWSRGGDVYRGRSVMTIRVHTRWCRPCGIGLSVCQCERRQLTRSRRRACRGPSDVTSCPLASRDLVWTTAHQGTQKVRASSMFGRRKLSQTVVWHVI